MARRLGHRLSLNSLCEDYRLALLPSLRQSFWPSDGRVMAWLIELWSSCNECAATGDFEEGTVIVPLRAKASAWSPDDRHSNTPRLVHIFLC